MKERSTPGQEESRIRDEGYAALGIPGRSTVLTVSMMLASPKIVELLIEYGANVDSFDVMGNDAFMLGSVFGRQVNIQLWLKRVKDYDLEQRNSNAWCYAIDCCCEYGCE